MTELMAIINLTPDSFSGDGVLAVDAALARIDKAMQDGAALIDIGAESTRPGAVLLSAEEEWRRIAPVAEALEARVNYAVFSLDTRHAQVARRALAHGFRWINDVSGAVDAGLVSEVAASEAHFILMHSYGAPADPKCTLPEGADPVSVVMSWAQDAIAGLGKQGIGRGRIIFDPGIGFGKTAAQSQLLIERIAEFRALKVPLLVGHSRKSFLRTDKPAAARDPETLTVSRYLIRQGVDYLRVHDVAGHAAIVRAGQVS